MADDFMRKSLEAFILIGNVQIRVMDIVEEVSERGIVEHRRQSQHIAKMALSIPPVVDGVRTVLAFGVATGFGLDGRRGWCLQVCDIIRIADGESVTLDGMEVQLFTTVKYSDG
jgi:hypothetical protein